MDPHSIPILAEVSGKVRYETWWKAKRCAWKGSGYHSPLDHRPQGELHPQIVLEDATEAAGCTPAGKSAY